MIKNIQNIQRRTGLKFSLVLNMFDGFFAIAAKYCEDLKKYLSTQEFEPFYSTLRILRGETMRLDLNDLATILATIDRTYKNDKKDQQLFDYIEMLRQKIEVYELEYKNFRSSSQVPQDT